MVYAVPTLAVKVWLSVYVWSRCALSHSSKPSGLLMVYAVPTLAVKVWLCQSMCGRAVHPPTLLSLVAY